MFAVRLLGKAAYRSEVLEHGVCRKLAPVPKPRSALRPQRTPESSMASNPDAHVGAGDSSLRSTMPMSFCLFRLPHDTAVVVCVCESWLRW